MKTPLLLNDAPYGSERTYRGARLAGSVAKEEGSEVRVVPTGDAAPAAHRLQKVPAGFDILDVKLGSLTLHHKLLTLPAELEIYPGHQAGSACGVGLSGKPASTIGFGKRFNPMLSMGRDEFVAALTTGTAPPPADMACILAANPRGAAPETVDP